MSVRPLIKCISCGAACDAQARYCRLRGAVFSKRPKQRGRRVIGARLFLLISGTLLSILGSSILLQPNPTSLALGAPMTSLTGEKLHKYAGYALGQYVAVGRWTVALTRFKTIRGPKVDPPAHGRLWLVTSWRLHNPTDQALQVHASDWSGVSLGVRVFAETGHHNYYGHSVVGHGFPDFAYVTARHTIGGNIAFEIFKDDRNPIITVSGRNGMTDVKTVTWKIHR